MSMDSPRHPVPTDPVVVPEVLDSLDDVRPGETSGGLRHVGCTLGPGCGCLGLPVAVLAGVAVTSLLALAWVLRALRLLAIIPDLVRRLSGRAGRGTPPS